MPPLPTVVLPAVILAAVAAGIVRLARRRRRREEAAARRAAEAVLPQLSEDDIAWRIGAIGDRPHGTEVVPVVAAAATLTDTRDGIAVGGAGRRPRHRSHARPIEPISSRWRLWRDSAAVLLVMVLALLAVTTFAPGFRAAPGATQPLNDLAAVTSATPTPNPSPSRPDAAQPSTAPSPTARPMSSPTAAPTPTEAPTRTPPATVVATPRPTPRATPKPTPAPAPTPTPPAPTPSPTPTPTPTPPAPTPSPTPAPTPAPTPSPTPSPVPAPVAVINVVSCIGGVLTLSGTDSTNATSYDWNLDGVTATTAVVQRTFGDSLSHVVSLVVMGPGGTSDPASASVTCS